MLSFSWSIFNSLYCLYYYNEYFTSCLHECIFILVYVLKLFHFKTLVISKSPRLLRVVIFLLTTVTTLSLWSQSVQTARRPSTAENHVDYATVSLSIIVYCKRVVVMMKYLSLSLCCRIFFFSFLKVNYHRNRRSKTKECPPPNNKKICAWDLPNILWTLTSLSLKGKGIRGKKLFWNSSVTTLKVTSFTGKRRIFYRTKKTKSFLFMWCNN